MAQDPKDIVTPDALTVAPDLLGKPIAKPLRRLAAMLADLLAVGVLAALPAVVFGVALSGVLVRAATRKSENRSALRRAALVAAGLLVFGLSLGATLLQGKGDAPVNIGVGGQRLDMKASDALGLVAEVIALQSADTDDERRAAARAFVDRVRAAEGDPERARDIVRDAVGELEDPLTKAAVEDAMAEVLPDRPVAPPDPVLLRKYADALEQDPPAAEALRPQVAAAIAAREVAAARRDARALDAELAEARRKLAKVEHPKGFLGLLRGLADDLGLGFGWTIVYFTVFTAWWQGQTPGKRLFRCRVVRLDGKPLTAWAAFNRAGGYAASAATGLLGFAEVLWDPNRQALHDRISRTVVLYDAGKA